MNHLLVLILLVLHKPPDIRLPKINIPKFDGDPRKFLKFKSLFSNLIHEDTTISNVRKLYYLQEVLEGPTEEFIRDLDMTETSYNMAWSELLNRYENKRVIIRALSLIFSNLSRSRMNQVFVLC